MKDLTASVREWLEKQGFPLEFRVARTFAEAGFDTDQGAYVIDPKQDIPREIDVIASTCQGSRDHAFRFSIVTECKWTQTRPWVVFTSRKARPTEAGSIAHLLGSPFAEAVLWFLAGDSNVLDAQRTILPARIGFSGRQALVEKAEKELFYPTIQGVVAAATAVADIGEVTSFADHPKHFSVVIPAIVLDGEMFEAYVDGTALKVEPVERAIVAWRGFDARSQATFVHIVTVSALGAYAEQMANYAAFIASRSASIVGKIAKVVVSRAEADLPQIPRPLALPIPWLLRGLV